jgi:hypothetical protein
VKAITVRCADCGLRDVAAHPDDKRPLCQSCQNEAFKLVVLSEYMSGRLDHLIPGLGAPIEEEDE